MDSVAVMAVEYGSVPDWIAGIGTAFATIVAALAVNREVQRRRQEQVSEFSHQARRVLCWLAVIEVPEYEGRAIPKMPGSSSNPTLGIIIHNGSEEPVVDFKAEVETDPALLRGVEHWGDRAPAVVEEPIVPPGDMQRPVYAPHGWRTASRVWMEFTDVNGTRWLRDSGLRLSLRYGSGL